MYKTKTCARCGNEYQPTTGCQKWCKNCGPLARKENTFASTPGYRKKRQSKNGIECKQYYREHLAEIKARKAAHHIAHREEENGRSVAYGKKHREEHIKYRIDHKAMEAIRRAKYMKVHPEKSQLQTEKRRALKYGNTPVDELLTETQWRDILDQYHHRCAYCGKKADRLTMDHVIPLAKGGKHSKDNIIPACRHCNCTKEARTPEQWTGLYFDIGGNQVNTKDTCRVRMAKRTF